MDCDRPRDLSQLKTVNKKLQGKFYRFVELQTGIHSILHSHQARAHIHQHREQFTIIPEPFLTQAEKLGFRNLYNITDLKIPFWWNGILSREAIVKAKRPLMLKLVRAMVEAIHIIKTEKNYAKALFKKNLGVAGSEGLERAYRDYSNAFPEIPYPSPEGVKTMLDDLAPRNPKAAAADPNTYVDMSLVRELETSGFIKQLYRR